MVQFEWLRKPENMSLRYNGYCPSLPLALCLLQYKVGFSSMWTENSQKYKLDFKGAEELETKLLTCTGLWRTPETSKKIYFCFIDYAKAFDCVDRNELWQVLKEMGVPDHLIYLLRN